MLGRCILAWAMAILALPAWAQEAPQDEKELEFNFKDASIDAVLKYVSNQTGWVFAFDPGSAKPSGTISAVSATKVPVSKCLDFLNRALRPHGLVILNPYSPGLPKAGDTLKVLDLSKALGRSVEIHVGSNPDDIPLTDQVRTQIIPLKAVNVVEVNKELGSVLQKAMGEGSNEVAISSYSNSVILTGRSEGINRAARILRVIDVSASAELKIRVFPLRNADATETAKTLNEVFKKEVMKADTGQQNPWGGMMRFFGGGGRDGGGGKDGGAGGPSPRALAHEMVRITAEPRTNSVIVSATEDNIAVLEKLILQLDDKTAAAIKLKLYPLSYADATAVAKLVNDVFSDTPTNQNQPNRGGRGGVPFWAAQAAGAGSEPPGATHEVRAVADIRTNSVLVAATEQKLALIDLLMVQIDRQVNDMLIVKIYPLKNADAVQMATILQALFRPQVQATQSAGSYSNTSSGGGRSGGNFGANRVSLPSGAATGSSLLPNQEIEITSDTRTRSIICKASREYMAIVDDVVKQLDENPTEQVSTFVYRFKNADALNVATALQNLLRSTQPGSSSSSYTSGQFGQFGQAGQRGQNSGPFSGMNVQGYNTPGSSSSFGSGTSGFGSTSTFGSSSFRGNLGPLEGTQEGPAGPPQEEPRREIQGPLDVQPDTSTNSIIVRGSPRDFRSLQGVLQELDRFRPQVLIKCLIADVTLDQSTQFGVQGLWENLSALANNDQKMHKATTAFDLPTSGLAYTLNADGGDVQAKLAAMATEGKLRVLATPRILALDNQTAAINVGKDVPRITNSTVNTLGNPVNSVTYTSVGIKLQVTPHINPDGLVTMIVNPEVSDVASQAEAIPITTGVTSPTFNVNSAQTTVSVRNGTTVIIGGLIRETSDDTYEKVPVLGDLPLLGFLFSSTSKTKEKRELMIFLTPYVAFSANQLEEITELEKSRLKVIDPRDIDAESDRWLERVRR